ncbi:autophagy protein Apg6-domain-containing protein, partial [Gorgonomyces haynaldii]
MNDVFLANFFCQNCGQAIKLDPSLMEDQTLETISNVIQREHTPRDFAQDSFILLKSPKQQDSQENPGNLSQRLNVANRLFDIISEKSTIDHPMCLDCADDLLLKMDRRIGDLKRERETYQTYLEQHQKIPDGISKEEIDQLEERKAQTLKILIEMREEQEQINKELEEAEAQLKALDQEESIYWERVNQFEHDLNEHHMELQHVNLTYEQANAQLQALSNTSMMNECFKIGHEGPIATINDLRLGRLPAQHVEWAEINAGFGQVALLMELMANKLQFKFSQYKIIAMGNFSRIEKTEGDKAQYELYGSSDIAGMLFWNRRFDFGLVALLSCLQELGDYAEAKDSRFKLPYRISKDKIGDTVIKLQFSQDETWTKALKYLLIDIKWMMAFCAAQTTK